MRAVPAALAAETEVVPVGGPLPAGAGMPDGQKPAWEPPGQLQQAAKQVPESVYPGLAPTMQAEARPLEVSSQARVCLFMFLGAVGSKALLFFLFPPFV
jgi:hypothetical protein